MEHTPKQRATDNAQALILVDGPNLRRAIETALCREGIVVATDGTAAEDTKANRAASVMMVDTSALAFSEGESLAEKLTRAETALPNSVSTAFMALTRLRDAAVRDGLTGIYNRMYTEEALNQALAECRRNGRPLALIIADIDHFKTINDTYGHLVGDSVLREFTQILKDCAKATTVLGRYGGDEFIALLPDTPLQDAVAVADTLLHTTRSHTFCAETEPLRLTASFGMATCDPADDATDADCLLKRADQALYAAKRAGRDRVRIWAPPPKDGTAETRPSRDADIAQDIVFVNANAPARVMVVDDEPSLTRYIVRMLEREGYEVSAHSSAEDALAELRQSGNTWDVVLTDIHMPGMTGLELLGELGKADDVAVKIVMTGMGTIDNAVGSLRQGAFDFIMKPVSREQLTFAIKRAIDYRRLVLENREYQLNLEDMVQQKSAALTRSMEETRQSYEFTLEALVTLLDVREQDGGQHSVRVRELSMALGRHMQLSKHDLQVLARAALLHDIGKVGVPDAVLRKPAALTEDEKRVMAGHVEAGYNVLRSAPWLNEVAEVVRAHHEHYDGKGYPNGCAGDSIPLGARIFAVVDAYDAMRSSRVYREALPEAQAVAEIARHSGSQFDPRVVDAFLACQPRIETLFRNLAAQPSVAAASSSAVPS